MSEAKKRFESLLKRTGNRKEECMEELMYFTEKNNKYSMDINDIKMVLAYLKNNPFDLNSLQFDWNESEEEITTKILKTYVNLGSVDKVFDFFDDNSFRREGKVCYRRFTKDDIQKARDSTNHPDKELLNVVNIVKRYANNKYRVE